MPRASVPGFFSRRNFAHEWIMLSDVLVHFRCTPCLHVYVYAMWRQQALTRRVAHPHTGIAARNLNSFALEVKYHVSVQGKHISPCSNPEDNVLSENAYKNPQSSPGYYRERTSGAPALATRDSAEWLALEGQQVGLHVSVDARGFLVTVQGELQGALLNVEGDTPRIIHPQAGHIVPKLKTASMSAQGAVLHPGSPHFLQVMHHLIAYPECGRALYATSTGRETYIEVVTHTHWHSFIHNWLVPHYTSFFTEVFLPELAWPAHCMGKAVLDRPRAEILQQGQDDKKRKALQASMKDGEGSSQGGRAGGGGR